MKYFILLLFVFLSGCASVHVKTENCQADYYSLFKDIDAATIMVCGGNMEIIESNSNVTTINTALELLKSVQ